jgi:hypothetical protein
MSASMSPVPRSVVEAVNEYIGKELRDQEKYDNRQPLDSSGIWSLHELARRVYAEGWVDGHDAQVVESRAGK